MVILLILAVGLALAELTSAVYRRRWRRALSAQIRFGPQDCREGSRGVLTQSVTNGKLIPFWCGGIQYAVPSFIALDGQRTAGDTQLKDGLFVSSYQRTSKNFGYTAARRGYFHLESAELLTKDPFFQYRMLSQCAVDAELYVYPDPARIQNPGIDLSLLSGEVLARRFFPEDPMQFRGIREYRPSDSYRKINWGASAKTGGLMVNEFYASTARQVYLLLDFDPHAQWVRSELKEDVLRAAAYLARVFLQNGLAVGVRTNARDQCGGEATLPGRSGGGQFTTAMRLLARILPDERTRPFSALLEEALRETSGAPAQFVLISFSAPPSLQERTRPLRANGLRWLLFHERGVELPLMERSGIFLCEVD